MESSNLSLLVDLYELTMAQGYFLYKKNTFATFDLFVRDLPVRRGYLIACGLEDILRYIGALRFDRNDVAFLKKKRIFSAAFLGMLRDFKFSGDIWAMPEGTVCFPGEPIIRVTAPIIEAQFIESFLLNTINLQTMIAAKASRVVTAARGRDVFDFSLRRTHGPEAGIKVARSSYIAGCAGTSNVLAAKIYGIPAVGTMAHSFVMSFERELDSFLAYSKTFPAHSILLVDTYDVKKGIANAITIGKRLEAKGYSLQGIRLDSGDIVTLSKFARSALDKAGLPHAKIIASGNLDEFKIEGLLKKGARVDSFGVGTNMGTSIDAPCLDVIYKLCEVTGAHGRFLPTMKLSKGKVTYPGRKQVYRVQDRSGRFMKDILAQEGEKVRGGPLLVKVVDGGRIVHKSPSLEKIREQLKCDLLRFPVALLRVSPGYRYPVIISPQLQNLRKKLTRQLAKRQ